MKISKDQIRDIPKSSDWRLYVSQFPRCVSEGNKWPSETGVQISYTFISRASESSDGEILIRFLDTLSGKVRRFLHDWMEGVHETGTGRQRPPGDLIAIVNLKDESNIKKEITVTLRYPIEADMSSEFPNFKAIYY